MDLELNKTEVGKVFDSYSGNYNGDRAIMNHLGLDIGTKNVVLSFKDSTGKVNFLRELNGYYIFQKPSKFIENMLNNAGIKRSDGTERPAKWIKLPGTDSPIVLGADAEELAYANNDTLRRPMAEGGVTSDDESLAVLASIVQGLIEAAEKEYGKFDTKVHVCYCTTAKAINRSSNIDFHKKVVDLILSGYETKSKVTYSSIPESQAIVLKESPDGTGIGLSWGAGTVTVSYVKWGQEIYSFCWVGSGDWIDSQVAMLHGYNIDNPAIKSRETPTTVSRRKHTIDLTPGKEPSDRVGLDIMLNYRVLIENVVNGIIQGFVDNESAARIDGGINIYMAGGTSSPPGFEQRVALAFKDAKCPFEIAKIHKSENPLFAVAEGCLIASEMQ